MAIRIFQVDAFSNQPFKGNPAGVVPLESEADALWMKNVAMEMNLAETAFFYAKDDGYHLRWFTPTVEMKLCGHATLASAHILWQEKMLSSDHEAKFYTMSGILTAKRKGDWIMLNFPSEPPLKITPPALLLESLQGIDLRYVGENRLDYIVELENEDIVRSLEPDLKTMAKMNKRGVIVTAHAKGAEYDFISRFFAPHDGINEDPVTGSAHCCLGPYWSGLLGKDELKAYQASARGGELRVEMRGERVHLWGQAVTVIKGELV